MPAPWDNGQSAFLRFLIRHSDPVLYCFFTGRAQRARAVSRWVGRHRGGVNLQLVPAGRRTDGAAAL